MIDTKSRWDEPAIKIRDDREDFGSSGTSEQSTGSSERKKKNIFRKLTKRKCRDDEKCESNANKKPMLILTFALCLIVMVAGGSVKLK